jgi:hypothetical protein
MKRRLSLVLGLSLVVATVMTATPAAAWFYPDPAGCTPGYWKQEQHFGNWQAPYAPNDLFDTYFEDAFPGLTLLEVLTQGGGGLQALGRHTVAGLLNAAIFNGPADPGDNVFAITSWGETYTTPAEMVIFFNNIYPGTKNQYEWLKNHFENANETGCPLGRAE